jgi:hypothetical protein
MMRITAIRSIRISVAAILPLLQLSSGSYPAMAEERRSMTAMETVNAVKAGADPSGIKDAAPMLSAAVARGGVTLVIPCGLFRLKANVPLPSHTEVVGAGPCTELRIDPEMAPNERFAIVVPAFTNVRSAFSNADFQHGNTDISIRNLRVTAPVPLLRGQYHAFSFYKADHVTVDRTVVEGAGSNHDGNHTVFIDCHNFRFTHNRHTGGGLEGSFDIWDGSSDFEVRHNYCNGGKKVHRCFTINGLSSGNEAQGYGHAAKTTSNGIVSDNIATDVTNVGIMVVGLYSQGPSNVYGHLHDIVVSRNLVDGVTRFHGIWVGEADDVKVLGNTIRNAAASCIYVASAKAGDTENIAIDRNICENSGRDGAIVIGNSQDAPAHVILSNNSILGTNPAYRYAIRINRGAKDTVIGPEHTVAGTGGAVLDQGTGTENSPVAR